jgi:ABC-type glycerol-3-phosphate transport system permease component
MTRGALRFDVIATIPTVVVYVAGQRLFERGLVAGAVK